MKKIAIVLTMLVLSACSDANEARRALTAAGYSDIRTEGYAFFGCDEKDTFHTKFTAKGPTGVKVSGVVCGGWFKGNTIRLD